MMRARKFKRAADNPPTMPTRLFVLAIYVMATGACAASDDLPPVDVATLEELAAQWSAGRTDPTCRRYGARGEYLGPNKEYCQWPTVVRGPVHSTVGGDRDSTYGYLAIRWERTFRDSSEARLVVDSLRRAFRVLQYDEWPCRSGGNVWVGEKFQIFLLGRGADTTSHRMLIIARRALYDPDDPHCPHPRRLKPRAA